MIPTGDSPRDRYRAKPIAGLIKYPGNGVRDPIREQQRSNRERLVLVLILIGLACTTRLTVTMEFVHGCIRDIEGMGDPPESPLIVLW